MKANYRALYLIADNLADLYEDGIPLILSLELLLELPINKEYKNSLVSIKNSVIKGESLGSSFYKNSSLYPEFFCGIVDIGESSGELVSVLRNLKEFYFNIDKVRRQIKNSIRYPLFIFCTLIILSIIFLMLIIPNLYETFNSLNKGASKQVSFFYELYIYLKNNKVYSFTIFMSGVLTILASFKYIKSIYKDKEIRLLSKIKILNQYYEYIFITILSIIMSSGIEISKGLDLCIKSIDIQCIKRGIKEVKNQILRGNEMGETLKNIKYLSNYSLSMVSIGEKGGNIDGVLKKAEKRLQNNLLGRLEKMVSYVMPAAIIFVSSLVVIFIFLFIVPMFDMIYSGVM